MQAVTNNKAMRIALLIGALFVSVSAAKAQTREDELWAVTVRPALTYPLWQERDAYDAGFALELPLEAAFELGRADWQADFEAQFSRFLTSSQPVLTSNRLSRLQYLYLLARFTCLCAESARSSPILSQALNRLYYWIERYWLIDFAPQWNHADFRGARSRLEYKLNLSSPSLTYYRAIIDEELYLFAIAADLKRVEILLGTSHLYSPTVTDILDLASQVFHSRSEFRGSGMIFDAGAWTDHPDYIYAGNFVLQPGLSPAKVSGIAPDSSHSCRLPRVLRSLYNCSGGSTKDFYGRCLSEVERQFFGRVVVTPRAWYPGFRTLNFMDGRNGVYRFGYATTGTRLGYAPYELSGTLTLGWWSFLGTARSTDFYAQQANLFPLAPIVKSTYLGPGTTRNQLPIFRQPDCFTNGMRELDCLLASKITGRW